MANTNHRLFDAFKAPSDAEWEAALEKALKGKPAEELTWRTEGFAMPPTVRPGTSSAPAGVATTAGNNWKITEFISLEQGPEAANKAALEALWKGVEGLR